MSTIKKNRNITVHIAPVWHPAEGKKGKSKAGHMWFELSDGTVSGYREGGADGRDNIRYGSGYSSWTFEITSQMNF